MIGWDFSVFWEIGRAVLEGQSPYAVEFSRYPPAAAFFFVVFGLLPFVPAFALWSGANVVLYILALKRLQLGKGWWVWLLYTPFLFNLLTGQVDVVFWWAAGFLVKEIPLSRHDGVTEGINGFLARSSSWIPALAGAFLTLKPQLAVVILPWFLLRWLRSERGILLRWGGISLLMHVLPLLYDPGIYQKWLTALQGVSEMKIGVSGGIFAFGQIGLPTWLLAVVGIGLAAWGWFQKEAVSRPAQLLAFPLTIWYDNVVLVGIGPAWLMVGVSWLAFGWATLVQNSLPLVLIAALPFCLNLGIIQKLRAVSSVG